MIHFAIPPMPADRRMPAETALRNVAFGELPRYVAVSVIALGVDVAVLYLLAVRLGLDAPAAGVVAYMAGLCVHYALAISRVFGFRKFRHWPAAEFTLYAASGGVGAGVSFLVLLAGERLGASLWSAKAVAVALAFVLTYLLRRRVLFSRAAARVDATEP